MKKHLKLIALSVLMILFLGTAVQVQAQETTEITVWHYFADSEGMEWLVEDFNENNSDIKVDSRYVHFSELENQITKGIMTGDLPDVLIFGTDTMARWADNGALADLTERAEEWGKEDKFYEGAWESGIYKERLFAIPQNINALSIFYNKELFAEAGLEGEPKNWEELREYAEKISDLGEKTHGLTFSATKDETGSFQFAPFLWQAGGSFEELDSDASKSAMKLWQDMLENGYTPKSVLNTPQYELAVNFASGNVGMMVNGPWALSAFDEADFDYGVFKMPVKEGVDKPTSVLGGESLAISRTSENKEAAWEFIKYFQKPETIKEWCKIENRIPARKDVVKDTPAWSEDEIMQVFTEQLEDTVARPVHPEYSEMSSALQTAIQESLTGSDVEEAMDKAADKVDSVLE
ncbi:MAG: sugar ABC transporter substrate-binding protein [Halanaerobiales bacterium]